MAQEVEERFLKIAPEVDFCSLRFVERRHEQIWIRRSIVQPVETERDTGAMITVVHEGGLGYGATCDLSEAGLRRAAEEAVRWAATCKDRGVTDFSKVPQTDAVGEYESLVRIPWASVPLKQRIEFFRHECSLLKTDDRITDWAAGVQYREMDTLIVTTAGGPSATGRAAVTGRIEQRLRGVLPFIQVTASEGSETQTRTFGRHAHAHQGGWEILEDTGYADAAPQIAEEVIELLGAAECPTGAMDLLLAPDQMVLQIHESIGHPLELDRILGDERNYAGTSFVRPEMFGEFRYGSELLNVTFDPTVPGEFASYGFDDDGTPAKKEYLIKDGILRRPEGGATSQVRTGLPGIANSRAESWYRPPIDRMANLNLEPGESAFDEMVKSVERGVYMQTNCSWSIDDSRNKFQFGCERGTLIEDGELTTVVKKPNYRGISSGFWRNLKMAGNSDTACVMGLRNCGKGEPNQIMFVGHSSPVCLFENVEVFGGA